MRSKLTKLCKKAYTENKNKINDIILFGSFVRGKKNPNDIDILIVFNIKVDKEIEYKLKKKLDKNVSLISKTVKNVYEKSFNARESILFEGYSLITKEYIASKYGFISLGLFQYQTKGMKNVDKTRFYYALNGRRKAKGIIEHLDAIKLSDNIIAVKLEQIEDTKEFFDAWKMDYKYIPSLIPLRLSKKHILSKVS